MTGITIEDIKADQAKLNAKIEAFERQQTAFPITIDAPKLNKGENYVGAILSADGLKRHHIILLPNSKDDINWSDATEWAQGIGGELPDRVESALMFSTLKSEFEESAYWTRETHAANADFAWCQDFCYGDQDYDRKHYKLRARAVRRIAIE